MLVATIALAATIQGSDFVKDFPVTKANLKSMGSNRYFILQPGYQVVLEGKEDGAKVVLVIQVLKQTKTVDGVETRVVREHESRNGKVVEISMNYFAFDPTTKNVYYFGEDVDMYRNGKVVNHEGSWRSGVKGAHFGLAMPGSPKVREKYYQEVAPEIAMDRAENISLTETLRTPAGKFNKCLKVEETTPLEPGAKEYKVYAPGVGLISDGPLLLKHYGRT
jgi:hypothetical protein